MRNSVRSLIWWSSRAFVKRHVLLLWATSRVLAMQIILDAQALCLEDGPSELAGGLQGPLSKSCGGAAI